MPKDDHIQLDAVVTNVFAGGNFEVKIKDSEQFKRVRLAGNLRKNRIRVILGDTVKIAVSPYDTSHGMIIYRYK